MTKPIRHRTPCDVCHRVHRGRCTPDDQLSIQITATLPGRVGRLLQQHIPHGHRSRFVARAVEAELDRLGKS